MGLFSTKRVLPSLRRNATPGRLLAYRRNASQTRTICGVPLMRACGLTGIMRRRPASS